MNNIICTMWCQQGYGSFVVLRRIFFEKSNTGEKSLILLTCFLFDHNSREFKAARDIPMLGSMGQVINSDRTPCTFHVQTRTFSPLKQEPLHHSVELYFSWTALEYTNSLSFLFWGIFIFSRYRRSIKPQN